MLEREGVGGLAALTGFGVTLETEHDFGSSVPSRRDVFSHVPSILLWINTEPSRQAEIGNLQLAVRVDEQVAGLQVTVQHVGAVDVFQPAQDLVDEGLEVGVGERLAGADDSSEIAFHELCSVV